MNYNFFQTNFHMPFFITFKNCWVSSLINQQIGCFGVNLFFLFCGFVRRTVKNSWSLTPPPRGKEHLETKGTKDKRTELRTASSDRASVFLKPLSHVMNAFAVLMLLALPAELQAKSLENFRSHLFTKCCFVFHIMHST